MKSGFVLLLSSLLPLMSALPATAHDACAMPDGSAAACAPSHGDACACDDHGMHGKKMGARAMHGDKGTQACACGPGAACGGACGADAMHGTAGCACGAPDGMHGGAHGDRMFPPRGHMGWMHRHPMHVSQELRYAPGTTTLTGAWMVARPMTDWFSVGLQGNYAWQTMPSAGAGHWFTDYMGILPQLHKEAGPLGLNLGALVGLGAMVRTFDAPGVGNDLLQLKAIWAVEPRVELSWRMGAHSVGLVGTYLWTPNMADLGGYSVGLETTFGGPSDGK